MFWSLSLQLLPDETVIEDSSKQAAPGVRPTYSVILTNKRAVFRFDGFGSAMTQSFTYDEITMAAAAKRMFITYLALRTQAKEYFLHVPEPDHWASRILDTKAGMLPQAGPPSMRPAPTGELAARRKRRELHAMIDVLRKHGVLSDAEARDKAAIVERAEL
jgi:hypothetical protein